MFFKTIFRRERFTQGAALLTITTFLSYVTGLLRDRILARTFGAGRDLDIYNTSFIIPDLLFNIFFAGMLSAAFIPVFTSLWTQGQKEKANELASTVLHTVVGIFIITGAFALLLMPHLTLLVAPGFNDTERETVVHLSRLLLLSPLLMAISSAFGAILISYKTFLAYGLSPILYNLGIIGGTFLVPWFGLSGVILGTLLGAVFHLLPRMIALWGSPFGYRSTFKIFAPNFLKVIKLAIPKMIGHPVEQFMFLGFTRIATLLAAGSVTAVSFARNFQSVPVSLFGIAFSVAIFPLLSEYAGTGDRENFLKNFWKASRDILFFTLPAAVGFYFLSELIIRIFIGGGKFSDENIMRTASVLSAFALSIPTESLIHLLARAFYALKNTITPVLMSVLGLVISLSFAFYKAKTIGIVAIPYGFFLGSFTEVICLSFLLRKKLLNFSLQSSPSSHPKYSSDSTHAEHS